MNPHPEGLPLAVSQTLALLIEIVERHVELAKEELARDARTVAWNAVAVAVGVPAVAVGYLFVAVSIALALAPWLGTAGGLATVGGVNLFVGATAIAWGSSRLRRLHVLDETVAEIRVTARTFAPLRAEGASHG